MRVGAAYLFSNLTPGCYKVQFATPAGFTASPANVGANDAIDSDAVGGVTGNYTLNSGDSNLTVDAGFPPASGSLSITKTANTTTYTSAGQVIVHLRRPNTGSAGADRSVYRR